MKNRILALLLVLAMALSLAACGGSDKPAATQAPAASAQGDSAPAATEAAPSVSEAAQLANSVYTNANVGKGMYPGTSEKGAITVECSTMDVMNTIKMTYATELAVARHTYDALVKLDGNNAICPAAAESWESSDDGMVWTFKLRQGAKWVDSTGAVVADVTANDFVFAWSELINPANASEYSSFGMVFKNAQAYWDYKSGESTTEVTLDQVGFKALDDYTLQVELENYQPYFLQTVKFEVLSPVYEPFYTEVGADAYGTAPDKMLYNGAFYMTEWVTDNKIVVEKNPNWYDADSVSLQKITFAKYTDRNTAINAFQGGEIDIIDLSNGDQSGMFTAEGYNVDSFAGGYSFYFYVNNLDEAGVAANEGSKLSDMRSVNLRKAVSYAIDRTQLISTVFKNQNTAPGCFSLGISSVDGGSFGDVVVAANGGQPLYNATADVAKAQEYLAAALEDLGYTDASQIDITLMTSESSTNELFSQVVQEQLRKNLGIEAKIEVLTIGEARARRNAKNYDMFAGGWGPDYNDPMTDLELWTSNNSNNHTGYASEVYDGLIEQTKTETDPVAREQIFVKAELQLAEDMPIIPTYWRAEEFLASEKIASGALRLPFQYYNLIYTTLAD